MVETFRFGPLFFDLDLVRRHIAAGDVKYVTGDSDITAWAEQVMYLDRARPDHKPHSFFLGINYDHLASITPERLEEPIIVVTVKFDGHPSSLVIDGNHRIAKAYMAGRDTLPSLRFDEKATKALGRPVKVRRSIG